MKISSSRVLTATAVVAHVGGAKQFKSGRQIAWAGAKGETFDPAKACIAASIVLEELEKQKKLARPHKCEVRVEELRSDRLCETP